MEDRGAILDDRQNIAAVEAEQAHTFEASVPQIVEHPFLSAELLLDGLHMCCSARLLPEREPNQLEVWDGCDGEAIRANE